MFGALLLTPLPVVHAGKKEGRKASVLRLGPDQHLLEPVALFHEGGRGACVYLLTYFLGQRESTQLSPGLAAETLVSSYHIFPWETNP